MSKEMNDFEKAKITKASTDKAACNVYLDAFSIGRVRIENFDYKAKNKIDYYLEFEEIALLAADVTNGKLIRELDKGPKQISIGGSQSSKNYDGAPESRILSFGKSGEKIFINITRGKGKLGDKKQIMPDGKPDLKISVGMPVDKFRSMLIYTHDTVNAYIATQIRARVTEVEEKRKAALSK